MTTTMRSGLGVLFVLAITLACSGQAAQAQQARLEPGDVILTVNGQRISGKHDLIDAVNASDEWMSFTVRDRRTGRVLNMSTRLSNQGYRFGVYTQDGANGGARVTSVMRNSAATRCYIEGGGRGSGPPLPAVQPGSSR